MKTRSLKPSVRIWSVVVVKSLSAARLPSGALTLLGNVKGAAITSKQRAERVHATVRTDSGSLTRKAKCSIESRKDFTPQLVYGVPTGKRVSWDWLCPTNQYSVGT